MLFHIYIHEYFVESDGFSHTSTKLFSDYVKASEYFDKQCKKNANIYEMSGIINMNYRSSYEYNDAWNVGQLDKLGNKTGEIYCIRFGNQINNTQSNNLHMKLDANYDVESEELNKAIWIEGRFKRPIGMSLNVCKVTEDENGIISTVSCNTYPTYGHYF